jgi:2-polyprenyl-3-methyl-5-hydroxy-6-metoxy-1,4-benzoquinol methylase
MPPLGGTLNLWRLCPTQRRETGQALDLKELYGSSTQRHPWETARARHLLHLLQHRGVCRRARRVLDVGAGDGFFAHALLGRLAAPETVVCFDTLYSNRHLKELADKSSDARLRFVREEPPECFDVILFLDVIEHVRDDRGFVSGIVGRRLASGGAVLVTVPAWEALYTRHDVALGHFRRYRPAQLRGVLTASGLEVLADGNLFHSLLLVRALQKLGELAVGKRSRPEGPDFRQPAGAPGVGVWKQGDLITRLVDRALDADSVVGRALASGVGWLPGLTIWALCRKR